MKKFYILILFSLLIFSCDKHIHEFLEYGTFEDSRDSLEYASVKIGQQTWMAQNLAYKPTLDSTGLWSDTEPYSYVLEIIPDTLIEEDTVDYYETYGVLYNWAAAQDACPAGWHLPSDEEWIELEKYLGVLESELYQADFRLSGNVDIKLKAAYGWDEGAHGDNVSGFQAFPGSWINPPHDYEQPGVGAFFWSSSIDTFDNKVWYRGLRGDEHGMLRMTTNKASALSIRCIKD